MRIFLVIVGVIFLSVNVILHIGTGLYLLTTKKLVPHRQYHATAPPELKQKLARYRGLGLILIGIGFVGITFMVGNALDEQVWIKYEHVFDASVIIGVVGAIIIAGATIYFKRHLTSSSHNDT